MPRIPWMCPDVVEQDEYLVFASRFKVSSPVWTAKFMLGTVRMARQMKSASGCVGMSLDADLVRGVFCTVSAWSDKESLAAFSAAEPHRSIADSLAPSMKSVVLTTWKAAPEELPLAWSEVHRRLREADQGAAATEA